MCGIIGYVGNRSAVPIIMEGLGRLEYRGYDSAGIAVVGSNGDLAVRKSLGKLSALQGEISREPLSGTVGIGHTRWATHGKPSTENAHPHWDCEKQVVVIHNGIIENYASLKRGLLERGHVFNSETDTETLAHLIEEGLCAGQPLDEAFRAAMAQVEGASAVIAVTSAEPDRVVAARLGNAGGIVIGAGDGEMFLASDLPAVLPYTRRIAFLASREMTLVSAGGATFTDLDGRAIAKSYQSLSLDPISANKGGYKHFMLKEIAEQPEAVTNVLRGRVEFDPADIRLDDLDLNPEVLTRCRRVVLCGMGTGFHAAMLGRQYIETLARVPAEVDNASEFRYRGAMLDRDTLVIAVTQSGETVDTLAAMEAAREQGAPLIAVCNTEGSQATRVADGTLFIRAGLEVGVASTKCLVNSVVALFLLAAYMGRLRGTLAPEQTAELATEAARLPSLVGQMVAREGEYQRLANQFHRYEHFLYLGRWLSYPVALEGALKLKEVSYIHAEGYPAGEMKHGPIALIDEHMPVIAIAPRDSVYDKICGNIQEVKARDGIVIALVSENDEHVGSLADHTVTLPEITPLLSPVLAVIPLQFLAYHIAVRRGCDVDQPRNLAKTVTVE